MLAERRYRSTVLDGWHSGCDETIFCNLGKLKKQSLDFLFTLKNTIADV